MVGLYGGMALLALGWVGLGAAIRRQRPGQGRPTVPGVCVVAALWMAPLVAGPVVLSTDLYSYLAQGAVVQRGFSAYLVGPGQVLPPGHLLSSVPTTWLKTPAPYGPIFLSVDAPLGGLAEHHLVVAVVLLRLVEVGGLALLAWALPRLARSIGADPVEATWLGLCSPVVLLGLVLSGHNDALMLGFLVAGLALAAERHPLAGLLLCTLATLVKAPAGAGVLFVALDWVRDPRRPTRAKRSGEPPRPVGWGRVMARLTLAATVVGGTTVAVTLLAGLGWGWARPAVLATPTGGQTWFTPQTALTWALPYGAGNPVRWAAAAAGGAFVLALLWHAPRLGVARALGLTLVVAVVAAPVVWPWYLTWGLVVLAACRPTQRSWALLPLGALPFFLVRPDGDVIGSAGGTWHQELAVLAVLALVLAGALRFSWRELVPGGRSLAGRRWRLAISRFGWR
jgi:alpha-1,6-mannosyltransferase